MSTATTTPAAATVPPGLDQQPLTAAEWDRLQRRSLLIAAAGAVVFATLGGALFAIGQLPEPWPRQLLLSYLTAFVFWLGVPLGCLVILMIQYLTGGVWGLLLRRTLEAATRTLPLFVLFVIPVLAGVPYLYEWFGPHHQEIEFWEHKRLWLNWPFFVLRTLIYFAGLLVMSLLLDRLARRQEREGEAFSERSFRLLSGPGLVIYGTLITFASVDWTMSLEPHWYSTIYPVMFAVGQVLTGFAFALAVVLLLSGRPPFSAILSIGLRRDLGNLLLTFVMLWAYMAISQLLLIWAENLPEEVPWYLRRSRDGWQVIAWLLGIVHFAIPFILLLCRDVKERPRVLAAVALGLLLVHWLDVFWWVEPAYSHVGQYFWWLLDVAATAALGGITVAVFIRQFSRRPVLPIGVPHLEEALHHD